MSSTAASPTTTSFPRVTAPGLDQATLGSVAGEERVLADHGAVADGEQVGAHRHAPGEDHRVAPDLRAERPQVQRVERRTGEQDQRVPLDQRLDDPEADVRQAPDADLLRLPPADEHPLHQDRKEADAEEAGAAEQDRPQVDVDHTRAGGDPLVASRRRRARRGTVPEQEQELQRAAEDVLPALRPVSPPRPGPRPAARRGWPRLPRAPWPGS